MKVIIFLMIFLSYGFLGFFSKEDKRPDYTALTTDKAQMDYLEKYHKNIYDQIINYQNLLSRLRLATEDMERLEKEWQAYSTSDMNAVDYEKERLGKERIRQEKEKAEMKILLKAAEAELAKQFAIIDGEVVDLVKKQAEEDRLLKEKREQEALRGFSKEEGFNFTEELPIKMKAE